MGWWVVLFVALFLMGLVAIWIHDRWWEEREAEYLARVVAKYPQRTPPDGWSIQIGEPDF